MTYSEEQEQAELKMAVIVSLQGREATSSYRPLSDGRESRTTASRLIARRNLRCSRIAAWKMRPRSPRKPCVCAFRRVRALPAAVFGPVECAQGRQLRIISACRARRSGVQPLRCRISVLVFVFIVIFMHPIVRSTHFFYNPFSRQENQKKWCATHRDLPIL